MTRIAPHSVNLSINLAVATQTPCSAGNKHRDLHTYFSTAVLVRLATLVYFTYLLSTEAGKAAYGAFLVVAVITIWRLAHPRYLPGDLGHHIV